MTSSQKWLKGVKENGQEQQKKNPLSLKHDKLKTLHISLMKPNMSR
jgi:hypothetical protein